MFDAMVESRGQAAGHAARWSLPMALLLHIVVIGALLVTSYLVVEAVNPNAMISFFGVAAAPALPPPPPPPPPAASSKPRSTVVEPVLPEELFQPAEVPEDIPIGDDTGGGEEDFGVPGGVPDGLPGGVRHGVPGGVADGLPGGIDPGPIPFTPDMEEPQLEHRVVPDYPDIARQARLQGKVIVQAVIEADGTVSEVTILRSSNALFDQAAIDAVKQWRYRPAMRNGRSVAVYFRVIVEFSLR